MNPFTYEEVYLKAYESVAEAHTLRPFVWEHWVV
jgi:hypothetical protein